MLPANHSWKQIQRRSGISKCLKASSAKNLPGKEGERQCLKHEIANIIVWTLAMYPVVSKAERLCLRHYVSREAISSFRGKIFLEPSSGSEVSFPPTWRRGQPKWVKVCAREAERRAPWTTLCRTRESRRGRVKHGQCVA